MDSQIYVKKGRRYRPIGYSDGFTGFPAEGIWAVYKSDTSKSSTCIALVGEFQPIDYGKLASLIKEKGDECMKVTLKMI